MHALLDGSPGGGTPLCYHVNEVMKQIIAITPQLKAAGKKAGEGHRHDRFRGLRSELEFNY
jgi:hypothetical protein